MCAAYARANSKEAATRKLAIKTLWRSAGRAGEPAMLSWEGIKWNDLFKTPVMESPQSKGSKIKFVTFVAGFDHHSDWLIDVGDMLVFDRGFTQYDPDVKTWLLPELQGTG